MNPIQKLLREQNTKDDLWCSALDRLEYTARNRNLFDNEGYQKEVQHCCDQAFNWHTTAQQQLIDVVIGMMNPTELAERIVIEYANTSGRESEYRYIVRESAHNVLQTQITLLRDAKKDL